MRVYYWLDELWPDLSIDTEWRYGLDSNKEIDESFKPLIEEYNRLGQQFYQLRRKLLTSLKLDEYG